MNKLLKFAGAVAVSSSLMLAACGGGGLNAEYEKIPTHPIYGDLPQLTAKWKALGDALKEKKAEVKDEKSNEKYKKLEEEQNAKQEKDFTDAAAKIKGNAIPFEVKDGTGYTVKSVTIGNGHYGGVSLDIAFEVTDKSKLNLNLLKMWTGHVDLIDEAGNVKQEGVAIYGLDEFENGKGKTVSVAFNGFDIAKMVFTK